MEKKVQYVKDAIHSVGNFVQFDGYVGRLAIKKGLDPNKVAASGDFLLLTSVQDIIINFPLNPLARVDDCPMIFTDTDLNWIVPSDLNEIYPEADLKTAYPNYTFSLKLSYDKIEKNVSKKKESKDETEGDRLMDFFFNQKPSDRKEKKESSSKTRFEFL